ncbi:MAG: fibronectin type III domain-containing protein [Pseudomonadota bacterium]|nr:fibronectin type III domain-containing protein [Pseudomonadota bacterium]
MTPFTIRVNPAPPITAGSATLSWTAPTENTDGSPVTDLAGYHIYYGTSASELTKVISVTGANSTSHVISGMTPGTYYFMLVAYTSAGAISGPSVVVSKTI